MYNVSQDPPCYETVKDSRALYTNWGLFVNNISASGEFFGLTAIRFCHVESISCYVMGDVVSE